jgi:hypothetical protein
MEILTSLDTGILLEGGDDADRQVLTANGITPYDGGDQIFYDGTTNNRWESAVSGGTSVEEVYVNGHYQRTATGDAAYECVGDDLVGTATPRDGVSVFTPVGFTIGTNGDLNVDGEQLLWMAVR